MKFYDRVKELAALRKTEALSKKFSQMTVITGRRRIGKTALIRHAFSSIPLVYFFVGKKTEALLCAELSATVGDVLGEKLGSFSSMTELFEALLRLARRRNFTLAFDEFQNFYSVRPSIFSDFQNLWDREKDSAKINLVFCGSLYSMMTRIFDDRKEPLYGRATSRLRLQPFPLATLKEILQEWHPDFSPDDLLTFYMVTGGVAKYVEQLIVRQAFTKEDILQAVFALDSYFISEGRDVISDEFGKDYGTYFSILSAIADGKTRREEIKSTIWEEPGGYLLKLENQFDLIARRRPFGATPTSRQVYYSIKDNFLTLWFRFFYKYRSAVEIGNLQYLHEKALTDYDVFSGLMLERYFRQLYRESGKFSEVAFWCDTKGQTEIDLVAANAMEKNIVFGEVKRNPKKISLPVLQEKAAALLQHKKGWAASYVALSLTDM